MLKSRVLLALLNLICLNESARILGVFPSIGYSQYLLGSSLMKELAARGHEVTVISPFSQKILIRNYHEIVTKFDANTIGGIPLYDLQFINIFDNIIDLYNMMGLHATEQTLKDPQVQDLLHSDATFDLVIAEIFLNEAHMGFAHHYSAPLILLCSQGAIEWANHLVANPAPFSHVPMTFSGYNDHMTFWQRLRNAAACLFDVVYKHLLLFPRQNELLQKYFPKPPQLSDLLYNTSLILLNSNIATNVPMAHVPSMIEIGGFHVAAKKLTQNLQDVLDKARDGAVLFSMGSNLKSSDLSKEKISGILRAFSKLKQTILWKWEEEDLPDKPDNVKISKWFPQQDILAHPNIRAFITHGGLLSTIEAVYNGVPMVSIPIFGDQKMNVETAVGNGFTIQLPFQELTEEKLAWALEEVLTNASYKEAAQKASKILRDEPVKPMDKAMFWIEYVIRHRGAPHLRTAALELHWYQYFLLDIFAFVLAVMVTAYMVCKILIFKLFGRTQNVNTKKNQ